MPLSRQLGGHMLFGHSLFKAGAARSSSVADQKPVDLRCRRTIPNRFSSGFCQDWHFLFSPIVQIPWGSVVPQDLHMLAYCTTEVGALTSAGLSFHFGMAVSQDGAQLNFKTQFANVPQSSIKGPSSSTQANYPNSSSTQANLELKAS